MASTNSAVSDGTFSPLTRGASSAVAPPKSTSSAAPVASAVFADNKQSESQGGGATTPIVVGKDPRYSPQKASTTAADGSAAASTALSTGLRPDTYSFVVSGTTFQIDLKYKLLKPIGHGAYGVVMYG